LPFTTWLRLQRMLEGTQTVCVLVGPQPMARSSAGLTVQFGSARGDATLQQAQDRPRNHSFVRFSDRLFKGLNTEARVIRARARGFDDVRVCLSTSAS
jgi:hypothetical protein